MFEEYQRFPTIDEQEPTEEEADEMEYPSDFSKKGKQKRVFQTKRKYLYVAS